MEPIDESLALLARLSSKPGVQSTLVLTRADGAIIRSEGLLSSTKQRRASSSDDVTKDENGLSLVGRSSRRNTNDMNAEAENPKSGEHIARAVWKYVQATEGLVEDMDGEDELRLLRVRTKKNELVVVPSAKYLLVIVHDTPPA